MLVSILLVVVAQNGLFAAIWFSLFRLELKPILVTQSGQDNSDWCSNNQYDSKCDDYPMKDSNLHTFSFIVAESFNIASHISL